MTKYEGHCSLGEESFDEEDDLPDPPIALTSFGQQQRTQKEHKGAAPQEF